MARYTKSGSISTVQQIDAELEKIEVAQAELLSRTGDTPNQMEDTLDMNSQRLINLPKPLSGSEPLRLSDGLLLSGTRGGGSIISEEPPVLKAAGDRWTRCSDMKAFLWYEDGDSGQWIEDRPSYGIDTIQNLSIPYVFDTVADMTSSSIAFPVGKVLLTKYHNTTSGKGGAKYIVTAGTSSDITGSPALLAGGYALLENNKHIDLEQYGAISGQVTTAAIQAAFAIQAVKKIPIHIPSTGESSQFEVDGQLEYHGYGLYGNGRYNSRLKSTYVGTLIKKMNSNDEGRMHDFTVLGGGEAGVDDGIGEGFGVDGVIGFGADGSGAGWNRMQMKNVHWRHMAQQFEVSKSLWCTFETVYARFVKRGVFFVGGGGGWNSTWFNNAITFINCLWDDTGEYAIDFVGSNLALSGTNTFQSGVDGLRINRDTDNRSGNNTIENLYTEFNSGSDITLDGTKLTLGTVMYQGGAGSANKPNTLHNILANNSDVIAIGRPAILDTQVNRITLTNGSTYTALYPEIVSAKNTADATSSFIYLPDRVGDKTITSTFTDLSTVTPAELNGGNLSTRSWAVYLEAPNGESASFHLYMGLVVSAYRMKAVGLQALDIDNNSFQINFGTTDYTFTQDASTGVVTILAQSVASGDVVVRMVQTVGLNTPTY